ncbi:uncharacterized protein [Macaca nemestrina]|uniref:uncharacterized protein isoform X7 n=1 Tax=Macaca nemestrina TaxID=9545 RepID=UPI0039B827BE
MVIDNEYSWLISMLLIRPLECNNIDFYIQLAKESCTTGQIGETPGENTATRHHLGSRQQPSPDTNCWFLNFGLLSLQKSLILLLSNKAESVFLNRPLPREECNYISVFGLSGIMITHKNPCCRNNEHLY